VEPQVSVAGAVTASAVTKATPASTSSAGELFTLFSENRQLLCLCFAAVQQ
jgi:hypothetical protein